MDGKKPISLIAIIIVILAASAAGFWYWQSKKAIQEAKPQGAISSAEKISPIEDEETLGGQIFRATQNPGSKLPKTNPFQDTDMNPLNNIVKNPF